MNILILSHTKYFYEFKNNVSHHKSQKYHLLQLVNIDLSKNGSTRKFSMKNPRNLSAEKVWVTEEDLEELSDPKHVNVTQCRLTDAERR